MAGEGQEMAPIMKKFMDEVARQESKASLLGANEIIRNDRENAGEDEPRKNLAQRNCNRPDSLDKNVGAHIRPQGIFGLKEWCPAVLATVTAG